MTRWQYLRINLADLAPRTREVALLNAAGAQGWELTSFASNHMAYLKRPLEEPQQATDAPQFARANRRRAAKWD